jgi:hypothetical protein
MAIIPCGKLLVQEIELRTNGINITHYLVVSRQGIKFPSCACPVIATTARMIDRKVFFISFSLLFKADSPASLSIYPLMSMFVFVRNYAAIPMSCRNSGARSAPLAHSMV